MSKSYRLKLEQLEDRLTPSAWGNVWPNPGNLHVSFVPDGTQVSTYQSNLFQTMNAVAPTNAWETAILQALQTWAVNANINLGLVPDGGQPLGTPGAIQGDKRFGDIRIAMAPETSNTDVADTAPFEFSGSSWDGAMVFNSKYGFGLNGAGQYDLFSVALHEAGHDFGFADETTDPTSANYALYTGVRSGLPSSDIANLQSEYGGARTTDAATNRTLATATYLAHPDQVPVLSDMQGPSDYHFYSFKTPGTSGTSSFTVQVNTAGLSLLEPSVTVYGSNGAVLNTSAATSPLNNNVTIPINNAQANTTYYVEVTGATSSVFGFGQYQMTVTFPTTTQSSSSGSSSASNVSLATAEQLNTIQPSVNSQGYTYITSGDIAATGQAYYYQITTPKVPSGGTETLTISANGTDAVALNPNITVFTASQSPVAFSVINNGGGTFTVQQSGVSAGTTYFIEVNALPNGAQAVGNYSLSVQVNDDSATTFTQLDSATMSQATLVTYQNMNVSASGLFEFDLSSNIGTSTTASAVRMTIYDQNNNQIFTLVSYANQAASTGFVFLSAGNYTVRFNAATQSGAPLPNLNWLLCAQVVSSAQSVGVVDTTLNGTGAAGIALSASTGNGILALLPVINPYANSGN
jgi:hypothetical protein